MKRDFQSRIKAEDWPRDMAEVVSDLENAPLNEPLKEIIDDVLLPKTRRQFSSGQGPDGAQWDEWYWGRDNPPKPHQTLNLSGALRDSFIGGATGHVENIQPRSMEWGSQLRYAGIHDLGATFRLGIPLFGRAGGYLPVGTTITIPERPIVGWTEEMIDAGAEIIGDYVFSLIA